MIPVTFCYKNMKPSTSLEWYARSRLARMLFADNCRRASCVIRLVKEKICVRLVLFSGHGEAFRAESLSRNAYHALEMCLGRVENQVLKSKEKMEPLRGTRKFVCPLPGEVFPGSHGHLH